MYLLNTLAANAVGKDNVVKGTFIMNAPREMSVGCTSVMFLCSAVGKVSCLVLLALFLCVIDCSD